MIKDKDNIVALPTAPEGEDYYLWGTNIGHEMNGYLVSWQIPGLFLGLLFSEKNRWVVQENQGKCVFLIKKIKEKMSCATLWHHQHEAGIALLCVGELTVDSVMYVWIP